jgi:hypothetical protein
MFGGQSGSKVFDDTWSYDTIGDKWQQITSGTPFARYGSLTCPEGYLFGAAASNRNDLWIYGNPPSQTNTLRISLPDGAIFLSAVASTLTLLLMILVTLIACVQCCKKRASLKKAEEFINV